MLSDFFKKQVAFKVVLVSVCALAFGGGLFVLILTQFDQNFLTFRNVITFFVLFAVFLVFTQAALILVSVNFFVNRPLQQLTVSMRRVEDGVRPVTCDVTSHDELGEVGQNFNRMMTSLTEMYLNRKKIEERLIKAEENLKYKMALEDKARIIERMNRELTGAFNDITLLYTVSQMLNTILDLDELVATVKKIFTQKFACDGFSLYLVSAGSGRLYRAAQNGIRDAKDTKTSEPPIDTVIAQETFKRRRSLYMGSIRDKLRRRGDAVASIYGGAVFSVPLTLREGVVGILSAYRAERDSFSPSDRQSLESIASQIAVAYDRSKLYTKTKELSVRDELTGAYNRRHFQQMLALEIKRAERFARPISLLMVDVDRFKRFNDTYGHLMGDRLLQRLTGLIKKNLREVDLLARFGGEEFVIMLADTGLSDAILVAQKIQKLVKAHLKTELLDEEITETGRRFAITVSIGVASYPESVPNPRELVSKADMALYMAKRDGRDLVRSYGVNPLPFEDFVVKDAVLKAEPSENDQEFVN